MGVFFVTKYALTSGIQKVEAEEVGHDMLRQRASNGFDSYYHSEGRDWHRTMDAAIAKAEASRLAKIASLKKQIAKLEKLTFPGVV